MTDWLEFLRTTAARVRTELAPLVGAPEGREKVGGTGAGGDETLRLDALAEEILLDGLRREHSRGSRFRVMSEEAGFVEFGADFPLLVVDPVDGSANAKMGFPMYCFSVGVYGGPTVGDGELGYVLNLANGDEFHAARGGGCFFNGRPAPDVRDRKQVEIFWIELSDQPDQIMKIMPAVQRVRKVRVGGALALGICYTAVGGADLLFHMKEARVIDFAAAKIILEEAGGAITDERGRPIDSVAIDLERHTPLVASVVPEFRDFVYECFK